MKVLSLCLAALMLSASASASAAMRPIDTASTVTAGITVHRFASSVRRSATTPAFFANFVAAGIAVSGVPCFNCVNGAPASALGIPDPFNYVPSNTTMQYNVAWTNLTFSGTCIVSIAITSGKTKLDSAKFKVPGISGAGGYDIGFDRGRPSFSGNAVITGKVKCGSATSSVRANLIFQ